MIGEILGHFKILDKLGAGGMGEVYRAHDPRIDRDIALKVLSAEVASDTERLERFRREAKALGALNHPNIVTIFEVGEGVPDLGPEGVEDPDDQKLVHYLAMELVEGKTLEREIDSKALPLNQFLALAAPIADALAAAHDRGITHRDLKPSNVMITTEGRIKILDFGLAKRRREADAPVQSQIETELMTREGTFLGTVPYMSPEQVEGKAVDHRTDIFSLGIVFYEMLAGRRPFEGESQIGLATAILHATPPPISEVSEKVPEGLSRLVFRCLEKDPERRYQSAKDLSNEIEDYASGAGASPIASSTPPSTEPKSTRRRFPTTVVLMTVAILAVALGSVLYLRRSPEESSTLSAPAKIESVAVLPLENLTGDPEQQYLVAGMHEAMISSIARLRALDVISRTTMTQYEGTTKTLPEIGRELGVDAIIEGSVLRVGDQVRITAQLIDAASDAHLWTESYDGDLSDVLALLSQVAQSIASEIQLALDPEAGEILADAATTTIDPEAQDLYFQARYLIAGQVYPDERVIGLLERALEISPDFAQAHAALSGTVMTLREEGAVPTEVACQRAATAARRAVEIDERLPEAHTALAWVLVECERRIEAAREAMVRAVELDPSNTSALLDLAQAKALYLDVPDEAVRLARRALELDPRVFGTLNVFGNVHYWVGNFEVAIQHFEDLHAIDPEQPWWLRQIALFSMVAGDLERAVEAADQMMMLVDSSMWPFAAVQGAVYAKSGREEQARELIGIMQAEKGDPALIAWIYAILGEVDLAFEWFDRAVEEWSPWVHIAMLDPSSRPLIEGDPRFDDLWQRLGLPERQPVTN